MKHRILLILLVFIPILNLKAQTMALVFRSEYEKIGDVIYDINDSQEGSVTYSITSGNNNSYYTINQSTGVIKINNIIPDTYNVIHTDILQINASATNYTIEIVDGYDYTIQNLDSSYQILDLHNESYINSANDWTVLNNLWGRGTAVPNVDFRMATIYKTNAPESTIFLWDTPSKANAYGGASVWSYVNVFWGNRKNIREDLSSFPFQISSLESLSLDFDFEHLFGTEEYKIAMNMFLTDESYLTNFSKNDGDFFFVFDQNGTWIPPYPYTLPDTQILGKPFAWLYDIQDNYEWRRVIIKDNNKLLNGSLNIKNLFDRFQAEGYINPNQYIYHIQLGIEITQGYGAVRFNKAAISMTQKSLSTEYLDLQKIEIYPNPVQNTLQINSSKELLKIEVFNILGQKMLSKENSDTIDVSSLNKGIYLAKIYPENNTNLIRRFIKD
ncbi:T9SS C-terminal target domain-containing protein [Lutibacter sp. HS1-25]|uniref:T9SS type A sorting domain-containing protein n=1 Tax=Lutibacter sp. HS1-25 TaxID=2485000 RepID=UPI00101259D8|nr:T9SS type A sorting domain-containing protein [Lutibacter sp. HS1-25]RXP44538.1 T9SS C-terminal target domain-containing protein [Lutibacter sp. HS1-25]